MAPRPRRDQTDEEAVPHAGVKPWEGEGGSFGSWLRQQREIRNISLREISDNTKIGLRYLEALEENRFEVLPANIFAKGFLREYAKYVGLDPDEVVNFFITAEQRRRSELGVPEPPTRHTTPQVPPAPNPLPWLIGGVIALLLIVAGIVWLVRRQGDKAPAADERAQVATPAPAAPVVPAAPAPAPPSPAPAAAGDQVVVNLSFTAECWVEAVIDGKQQISELRVQGESMRIVGTQSVVLTLGNAGSVRGEVNGRPLTLSAAPGQVVRGLLIDRAAAGLPPLPAATPAPPGAAPAPRPPVG